MGNLRKGGPFECGLPLEERVGDRDQRRAGDEEEAAVEGGEPEARRSAGQVRPEHTCRLGGQRRPSVGADPVAALAHGLDHRRVTGLARSRLTVALTVVLNESVA